MQKMANMLGGTWDPIQIKMPQVSGSSVLSSRPVFIPKYQFLPHLGFLYMLLTFSSQFSSTSKLG